MAQMFVSIPMNAEFSVETLTDIPNEETRQSLENIRLGVHLSRPFSSVRELMEDLDADREVYHSDLF